MALRLLICHDKELEVTKACFDRHISSLTDDWMTQLPIWALSGRRYVTARAPVSYETSVFPQSHAPARPPATPALCGRRRRPAARHSTIRPRPHARPATLYSESPTSPKGSSTLSAIQTSRVQCDARISRSPLSLYSCKYQ